MDDEVAFSGVARQAELIGRGEVSSLELTEHYLERIARIDPKLNSFREVFAESALEEARRADERRRAGEEGPLLGVPIAVKDGTEVKGRVTGHGTACFDELPASEDSDLVSRIRAAGAVPVGKTNLPELAIHGYTESPAWGVTRNPWDTTRTPGGSSGGSAAAVAAGLVPIAHGSDGAGSIRWPAAHCGLFGLKPQAHRVTMEREHYTVEGRHWHGLSVNGCISRSVLDTALFLDAVTEGPSTPLMPPRLDRSFAEYARTPPGSLRVAVSLKLPRAAAPPVMSEEARQAVAAVETALRSLGHTVERRDPDFGFVGNHAAVIYLRGIGQDVERTPHPERLERRTRGYARIGRLLGKRALRRALRAREAYTARINRLLRDHDILLMPASGTTAFEVGRFDGRGALRTVTGESRVYASSIVWNYTGQPAAMVPVSLTGDGLPVAAQLVSRPNDEGTLLSLAAQLESELRWTDRRPPLD